ncbi:hypothetical protein CEUSTIGMA_g6095.t1 [Chlamydomonas eustigma]|uniref:CR-type domain-containing protein n=1 Tax=Chlamydomonas eustigma TaxID=1157962 RepID=A0A250X6G4_9CHLO|nr:hypothetical protein CEUSTIGMA_g6095.t1 [Chlamydomonas eustigma]|eukprot:GAX78657.1 hypothetical protein CEUSTIGMA_g6095.t1 [Chlamydomonas eustigma]
MRLISCPSTRCVGQLHIFEFRKELYPRAYSPSRTSGNQKTVCFSSMKSVDSDDDMGQDLSAEFERLKDHNTSAKGTVGHLDLLWKIGKKPRPESCTCCKGSRERECDWCHGTGVLTIGDSILCSTAEHNSKCPVCKGVGYSPCSHCRGTGFRAQWLQDPTSSSY